MLNHFNFKRFGKNEVLVTNDFGRYEFLSDEQFRELALGRVVEGSSLWERLHKNRFLVDGFETTSPEVIDDLRAMKSYLFSSTALHIFVVTDVCNLSCIYCQAKDKINRPQGYMTPEIGRKCIDMALQSPSKHLTFEFQGGEPLINFPVIKSMIEYSEEVRGEREIEYTVVSNLSLLTKEILDFLLEHHVSICTSLDGPEDLHNRNRQCNIPDGSYALMKAGVEMINRRGFAVGGIETTTRHSLSRAKEIVRAYEEMGSPSVFLRPLTPLGFAKADWDKIGYTPAEYLAFYREAFQEVLRINKETRRFPEQHATYFLSKILGGYAQNYMELRSPCGASVGQLAYYYDGSIYTCDEARMVAEAGDSAFKLGDVFNSRYQDLVSTGTCKATCVASTIETIPGCCDCVYQPYCGVCPVVNYAHSGDIFPKSSRNYRCEIYGGMLDYIFELLHEGDSETISILKSWVL